MLVLPNPTTGTFEVTGISYGQYEIMGMTGQLLQSGELTEGLSIDISGFPKGIYFLSVKVNEQKTIVERIVKI